MRRGYLSAIDCYQQHRGACGNHCTGKQRGAHQRSISQTSHRSNPSRAIPQLE
jgi:hypothetical protein